MFGLPVCGGGGGGGEVGVMGLGVVRRQARQPSQRPVALWPRSVGSRTGFARHKCEGLSKEAETAKREPSVCMTREFREPVVSEICPNAGLSRDHTCGATGAPADYQTWNKVT